MKVISLLQPHATLMVIGVKKIETRTWNTSYRGRLLIHASKGKDWKNVCMLEDFAKYIPDFDALQFGAIIGSASLFMTQNTEITQRYLWLNQQNEELKFGDYSPKRMAWYFDKPKQFPKPIPCNGHLGIWDCPEEIELQIIKQENLIT